MDQELDLAARAGISFFAFVQYPNNTALSRALANYLATSDKRGVHFAAIIELERLPTSPADAGWDAFIARYAGYFALDSYESVATNASAAPAPLVFIFGGKRDAQEHFGSVAAMIAMLRAWAAACVTGGGAPPHFAILDGGDDVFATELRASGAVQSRSSYALNDGEVNGTFADQMALDASRWKQWADNGDDVIPLASTGWDPRCRADGCAGWIPGGEGAAWTQTPTATQVAQSVGDAVAWACVHGAQATTRRALVYAWNENSEGGWLVPTLGEGAARVDALHNASGGRWSCAGAEHRLKRAEAEAGRVRPVTFSADREFPTTKHAGVDFDVPLA